MVSDTQCICRACEGDFKHGYRKHGYRYRWMRDPGNSSGSKRCIVASCTETSSIIHTGIVTKEKIAEILQEEVLIDRHLKTPLCESHYKQLHRLLHRDDSMYSGKQCCTCNARIHGMSRHCPNPKIVQQYLSQNSDTDIPITENDYICTSCYNFHLLIVQNAESQSTDSELKELLSSQQLWNESYPPHIAVALKEVINRVGAVLLRNLAVLFPDVYRCFLMLVNTTSTPTEMEISDSDTTKTFPKRYLFACITSFFGKNIVCQSKQRQYGVLMYRMAFLKLVGTTYFTKHMMAFQTETPVSFFQSYHSLDQPDQTVEQQHMQWYEGIRDKIWERITLEDQLPPSWDALKLHWLRCLWVIDYWRQSHLNNMTLLPMDWFGWKTESGTVQVEWDSPENLKKTRESVAFLTHGCGCKTGYATAQCKCVKSGRLCGPGSTCTRTTVCQNSRTEQNEGNRKPSSMN